MFATHPEMAKRWAAETPSFSKLPARVKAAQGGLASLSGDGTEDYGIGGLVNKLARPIQRLLSKPTFSAEAVSSKPLSDALSRRRFELALENADDRTLAEAPFETGQGAWSGDNGLETNPVYMQELPRSYNVGKDERSLGYAANVGQLLGQHAVPVQRVVPGLIDTPDGANALLASDATAERIKALAKKLGVNNVVAQQPGQRANIFALDPNADIAALMAQARAAAPGMGLRYGRSDPGLDRVLIGDVDYADVPYSRFGPNPRTGDYQSLERSLLGNLDQ